MKNRTKIIAAAIVGVTLFLGKMIFVPLGETPPGTDEFVYSSELPTPAGSVKIEENAPVRHVSDAFALVEEMRAGWNLGNALDSLDHQKRGIRDQLQTMTPEEYYEKLWGNPVTTSKVISDVAAMGFGAVRIPVTWQDHMTDDLEISAKWLMRVQQIVDDVIDNGMYCIINLHHDTGSGNWPWLKADSNNIESYERDLRKVWSQIASFFQDYDNRLLFEGFNEILDLNDRWSNASDESYAAVDRLNQAFVDTVRATGGMNARRFLVINPYAASVDSEVLGHMRLPEDTIKDHLIIGVHTYAPAGFTWTRDMASWTPNYTEWDDEKNGAEIEVELASLYSDLISKGTPVIISECGAWNKNNSDDRSAYAAFLVEVAAKYQVACFWWDGGGKHESVEAVDGSALYDRYNEKWFFPEVAESFTTAAAAAWEKWGEQE